MEVTAFYNDDTSNVVTTGYEVIYENNTDKLLSGQTKVTIQYKGKTVDQPITVGQKNYVSISIKQNPTKMNYYEGDDFDKTGMIVEATDDNGNKEIIEDYELRNDKNLQPGDEVEVKVVFRGKEATVKVAVESTNGLDHLSIKNYPDKMIYAEGEDFDDTGLVVEAVYDDERTEEIDYTIENGKNLTVDNPVVKIKYKNVELDLPLTVYEDVITSIQIETEPTKTEYYEGEKFDKTGMVVEAIYKSGKTEEITNYEITNGDNLAQGQNSVRIKYGKFTVDQPIVVDEVSLVEIRIKTPPTKHNTMKVKILIQQEW